MYNFSGAGHLSIGPTYSPVWSASFNHILPLPTLLTLCLSCKKYLSLVTTGSRQNIKNPSR